jgi:hypothetical protein
MTCTRCRGERWVCEAHPDKPWPHDDCAGQVAIDHSTISNNGTGLFTVGAAVLDVSNSNIAFNAQGANGSWLSFGNNRVHRNTAAGTPPTAIGALTHDVGQQ